MNVFCQGQGRISFRAKAAQNAGITCGKACDQFRRSNFISRNLKSRSRPTFLLSLCHPFHLFNCPPIVLRCPQAYHRQVPAHRLYLASELFRFTRSARRIFTSPRNRAMQFWIPGEGGSSFSPGSSIYTSDSETVSSRHDTDNFFSPDGPGSHSPPTVIPRLHAPVSIVNSIDDASFVRLYTNVLHKLCSVNGMNSFLPNKVDKVSIFYSTFRQPFSLESYISRLVSYTHCSRSVFVNALVYLDRIKKTDPRLAISEMNVHRVLITAVVLSVKFLEDELYRNSYFAKVGGIQTVQEFNRLERTFLEAIGWAVHVENAEYAQYERQLGSIFMLDVNEGESTLGGTGE